MEPGNDAQFYMKEMNMAKATKAMIAQMVAIAAAPAGTLMMSQEEGAKLVEGGFATVDTSNTEGDKAAVSLTDAGRAELPEGTSENTSGFSIDDGVAIPETKRAGRKGGYPFDQLEIGQSFHVPVSEKRPNPAATLQSSVSGARARYAEDTGETETATRKVYAKNEDGSFQKDEEGKRVVASTEEYQRPVMKLTRDFIVKPVDGDDPSGEGARVWRVELSA